MQTVVLQSFRTHDVPGWIGHCQTSVRRWASARGYDYRFLGDELFDLVPDWYRDKVGDKYPVAADYARLVLLRAALEREGYQQAVWLDADLLVFDPTLKLDFHGTCAFGRETWIQPGDRGRPRATRNVHNAVCVFRAGCPVLPFLIQTVESIVRRADPGRIAPQMVGPKLLSALHNIAGFPLLPQVGALSPCVLAELGRGGGASLDLLRRKSEVPLQAANICASVCNEADAERAVNMLREKGTL